MPAPLTSTSLTHVYYLDGGQVKAMVREGSSYPVARVPSGPRLVSAFAINAAEDRIAVSVLDYSRYPAEHVLYNSIGSARLGVLHVHNGTITLVAAIGELVGTIGFQHG